MSCFEFPEVFYNLARVKKLKIKTQTPIMIKEKEHIETLTEDGAIIYTLNGVIHREDNEAAFIYDRYNVYFKFWLKNGLLHRDTGEYSTMRTSGIDYSACWYKDGKRHREGDLPAETSNQNQIWYQNDEIHRGNGKPAWIKTDFSEDTYWLFGKKVSKEQAENFSKLEKKVEFF